jgi:MFS family permease
VDVESIPTKSRPVQRLAVALTVVTFGASAALLGTSMVVIIGREASPFAVSLIATVHALGVAVFAPVWGTVADYTGRRKAMLVVLGGCASATVVGISLVDGVWLPIALRAVYGVFVAGYAPLMLTVVGEQGTDDTRGRSAGYYYSVSSVGSATGQAGAGFLLGTLFPSDIYLVIAGVGLASTLAVALVHDPTPTREEGIDGDDLREEIVSRLLPRAGEREHLRRNGLRWLYLAVMLRNVSAAGIGSLAAIYVVAELAVPEPRMGLLIAVNPALSIVLMYLLGRLSDARGRKPLIVVGTVASGGFGLLLAAAGVVPDVGLYREGLVGLAFATVGFGVSALFSSATAFVADVAPLRRESEMIGLLNTSYRFGGIVGPPLVGALATLASYEAAFASASVLAFVGAGLISMRVTETRGPGASSGGLRPDRNA